ncbi:MAG: pyrroloquinoline quinone-dependent dehydrogenase [Candidatus Korobacteraceae bacterium]
MSIESKHGPARRAIHTILSARVLPWMAIVLCACVYAVPALSQSGAQSGEWRYYGGDSGSTRYSPLDQINATNVKQLQVAWRWKTDNFGPTPESWYEATPLMVGGVLYTTAGFRRSVAALDAATGETLWVYRPNEGEQRWRNSPRRNSGRGLAYWTDGKQKRVIYITPGYHLIALDATTGIPVPEFGNKGIVDLKMGLTREADLIESAIGATSPPIISKDVVMVGAALLQGGAPKSMKNVPGSIRGYDVRTGKRLWIFNTIPQPGEFGNDTWQDKSWSYTGNTGAWAPLSVDEELGYLYVPVEDPTGDWYGGHRKGNNLFSSSLVCLDVKTGKRVWHYQMIHHDIWDFDLPAAPILVNLTVDGKPVKAVAQISKQAFTYVFDRVTGKPIWPIEEKPVEQTDLAGEWTSPTQPFPTRPAPFDRQGMKIDDLIDFTPELRAEAIKIVSQYRYGSVYNPPSLNDHPSGTKGTIQMPDPNGGGLWDSAGVDPETGVLFITSMTRPRPIAMLKSDASDMNYVRGGASSIPGPQGLPLVRPPWGRITAIDLNTGEHLWMVANGETPDEVKNHPALKGLNIPKTGKTVRGGVLITKTLLFAGAADRLYGDKVLQAINKKTGERIAALDLPGVTTGVPMTYMHDGAQYVVVAVGDRGMAGELVAFKLPDEVRQKRVSQTRSE